MLADGEITLGIQRDLVIKRNDSFYDVDPPSHGLYLLGTVPDDGFIKSVCVSGAYNASEKEGAVYIFVIDDINSKLRDDGYKVSVESPSQTGCRYKFDNKNNPKKSDQVVVYIPQEGRNKSLHINFRNASKTDNAYKLLEHDVVINETKRKTIKKGLEEVTNGYWQWKKLNATLELNVKVTISCKITL